MAIRKRNQPTDKPRRRRRRKKKGLRCSITGRPAKAFLSARPDGSLMVMHRRNDGCIIHAHEASPDEVSKLG